MRSPASARALVRLALTQLRLAGVPEAAASAHYLLAAAALGPSAATLSASRELLARNVPLNAAARARFHAMIARRSQREPLQYILGVWDFGPLLNILVRPPLLVPRPETEELVALAQRLCREGVGSRLLDIGCGSGVVGIALLHALPLWRGDAVDASPAAAALTTENATLMGVGHRLRVHTCDVFKWTPPPITPSSSSSSSSDDFTRGGGSGHAMYDIIVSNPPYIPDEDLETLAPEVSQWEDPSALAGGSPQGAAFILRLLSPTTSRVSAWLRPGGRLLLETHTTHPALLRALLVQRGGEGSASAMTRQWSIPPASGIGSPLVLLCHDTTLTPWAPFDTSVDVSLAARAVFGGGCDLTPPLEECAARIAQHLSSVWVFVGAYADFRGVPRFVELRRRREGE